MEVNDPKVQWMWEYFGKTQGEELANAAQAIAELCQKGNFDGAELNALVARYSSASQAYLAVKDAIVGLIAAMPASNLINPDEAKHLGS